MPRDRSPNRSWLGSNHDEYWRGDVPEMPQQQWTREHEHVEFSNTRYPPNEQDNEWFHERLPPSRYPPQSHSEPRYGFEASEVKMNHSEVIKKVVPAESIFDSPGRRNRPSHVSRAV